MAVDAGGEGLAAQGSALLRVFFIPFFLPKHTIPMAELASHFAARGVDSTVVINPANGALISHVVDRAARAGLPLRTLHCPLPDVEDRAVPKVYPTPAAVQRCHHRILRDHRPDAVVADFLFWWASDVTDDLGIPWVSSHVTGAFPTMAMARALEHWLHADVADDNRPFLLPNLPGRVEMVKSELPHSLKVRDLSHLVNQRKMFEVQRECFGVVVNTFYDLEPAYCDLFRQTECQRVWFCGPCTLWPPIDDGRRKEVEEEEEDAKGNHCVAWLDKQATASVVYVGFDSIDIPHYGQEQHREMARGLQASGRPFLWVLKESDHTGGGEGSWLPEGFEDEVRGRGLVVSGWVPHASILNHRATGAFVTQLAWNSMTEGLHACLPMISACPLEFEQFIAERLVVDILRVGVRMWEGFPTSLPATGDAEKALVKGEAISRAVSRFAKPGSADEEVEAMRKRAGEYGAMLRAAVREGGSSYNDLGRLIDELKAFRPEGGN